MKDSVYDILDYYKIYYEPSNKPEELLVLCPFHNDTSIGSALFNTETEVFHCFSCNEGSGDKYNFISQLEGCSYDDAIGFLDNGFQHTKQYDLQRLKHKLDRSRVVGNPLIKEYTALEGKFKEKVFMEFTQPNVSLQFKAKWIIVLSYLVNIKDVTKEVYDSIFELYLLFLNDIQKEMEL